MAYGEIVYTDGRGSPPPSLDGLGDGPLGEFDGADGYGAAPPGVHWMPGQNPYDPSNMEQPASLPPPGQPLPALATDWTQKWPWSWYFTAEGYSGGTHALSLPKVGLTAAVLLFLGWRILRPKRSYAGFRRKIRRRR